MYHNIVDKMSGVIGGRHPLSRHDIPPGHGGLIEFPDINDVLSGRGGRINNHPGNIYYRKLVSTYKHSYLDKNTKKLDKVKIADHIVVTIRNNMPSGRFLKEDTETKWWKEIGDEKARKKAGQAMREKATETRRELEEGTVSPIAINRAPVPVTSLTPISPEHPNWSNPLNNPLPISTLSNAATPIISHSGPYEVSHSGSYEGGIGGAYCLPDPVPSGYPQAGPAFSSNNIHIAARPNFAYSQAGFPTQQMSPHRPYSDIGKPGQSTIPEDKPPSSAKDERHNVLGAKAAAFNRTFNPLNNSSSTNISAISSLGNTSSMKSSAKSQSTSISSKASISINTTSPVSIAEKPSPDVTSAEDDAETKSNNYLQQVEHNSAGATRSDSELRKKFQNDELGFRGFGDTESERSYLPFQLTKQDKANSGTSMHLSGIRLSRSMELLTSSPLIGSVKDMSLNADNFRDLLGSSDADLNGPDLTCADEMGEWVNTSQNTRRSSSSNSSDIRERFKSETSFSSHDQMSFRLERGTSTGNSSNDAMSIDSRRSVASAWLSNFKGMHGLPPGGDLRARFFSDCSNRSMFSELSSDMLALDLAADPLLFLDPPSPPISPPTSP